ncbi:MAG: NAD(P)H-dependent oxidoreductase [Bacteroidetes bacterium]|nr:NAD(P)H-dependent oxidoreductase [Bacteroidota bacterium]
MKKILVILGHPNPHSLNAALAKKYAESAQNAGHELRFLALGALQFDPVLRMGYAEKQSLEPDLIKAQEDIVWANHLVLVYPSWWGSIPALLKGFFDRTLLPGFAFKYKPNSPWWDKYLTGKSARIVITMDTPAFYNTLVYGNANIKMVKAATLQYCGINPVKVTRFDSVRSSNDARRAKWLNTVAELGAKGI